MPLKIGFSSCFFHADPARPIFKGKTLLYLEESLAHWVMSQGDLAYMVPTAPAHISLADLVAPLDALVLQGGSDVAPQSYGETPLKLEWAGDAVRDAYEIALLNEFRRQLKPVLGICRGAQLVNVAFGGTLIQDIPSQRLGAKKHRDWEAYELNFHNISFEKGSRIEALNPGLKSGRVNSIHHQGLRDLGKGLLVEARSEGDGLIEAISNGSGPWLYAVQWHPEFQNPKDTSLLSGLPLLKEFLSEAKKSRGK